MTSGGRAATRRATTRARGALRPIRAGLVRAGLVLVVLMASGPGAASARAQDALVLSGGGSRGLAHVGAIAALEEHGYEPEIVVGASMGAVIGSLYAAGYSPTEIEALIHSLDWRQIFAPQVALVGPASDPRYPVLHLSRPPGGTFGVRHIVPDWRLNRMLVLTLFPALATAGGEFDRLPRRFRAVATDLADLSLLAPDRGNLPLLVRASLSAPAFFDPVRWHDRWLLDGGARDYLPVDVALELGADSVIGVDVVRPPDTVSSRTAADVAQRTVRLMLQAARGEDARPPDLLIVPPLPPDLSATVFPADPSKLIAAGYVGARDAVGGQQPADPGDRHASPRNALPRHDPPPRDQVSFRTLHVDVDSPALEALVERALGSPGPDGYRTREVLRAVDRLYATGLFQAVWPWVEADPTGELALRVRADAAWSRAVEGALAYDTDRGPRGWARAGSLLSAFGWPAVVSAAGSLERRRGWLTAGVESPLPIWPSLRVSAAAHATGAEPRVATGEEVEVWRAGGQLGLDWLSVEPEAAAALALVVERLAVEGGESGVAAGPELRLQGVEPLVRAAGLSPSLTGTMRAGAVRYWTASAGASLDLSLRRLQVAPLGHAAFASARAPADVVPGLGDDRLIPGVAPHVARTPGHARLVAGLDLAYPLPHETTVRLRTRTGVSADPARPDDAVWRTGTGLSLLWWTPFGQVEVGAEYDLEGSARLLLQLGPDW